MANTIHTSADSIYRMVLNRLPFVINDETHVFTGIVILSRTGTSITIQGDWTAYLRINTVHTFSTPATAEVQSFSYDGGTGATTITYITLIPTVVAGATLAFDASYNEQLISTFIYEMMVVMQNCFLIEPASNIGNEAFYSDLQKIILADLVAYRILFATTAGNAQYGSTNTSGAGQLPIRYIKTAATDGISTTWEYLNIKNTAFLSMDAKDMMDKFSHNAACVAKQLGCAIEVCDGAISCCGGIPIIENPFIVAGALPPCNDCKIGL